MTPYRYSLYLNATLKDRVDLAIRNLVPTTQHINYHSHTGILKMTQPTIVRSALLLLTLSAAACNSATENTRPTNTASTAPVASPTATMNQPAASVSQAKLNLNTASESEFLAAIPDLGKRMTHEFEEYRPYRSIQQFRREMGKYVKPEQIAEYEKHVYVPITPNEADAATLQQIPGLDAKEAEALIAARPYASSDAFLAKLAGSVSAAEVAIAKSYLNNQ